MRATPTSVAFLLACVALSGCLGTSPASDWAYEMTGIRTLQGEGLTGKNVRVAIVDTGIDADHESLTEARIVAWKDFVNGRAQPYDDQGHGSHVAGIIAAHDGGFEARLDGFRLEGGAPGVSLIIVKAISAQSDGETSDVVDGINFAVDNGADIICLSLGSQTSALNLVGDSMTNAVNRALNSGVLVVAAAGNRGGETDDVESPANIQGVIAVGSVDEDRKVSDFSNRGGDGSIIGGVGSRQDPNKKPEIVGPGEMVRGAWQNNEYRIASGTSQATPFVCSGLALVLERFPELKKANTRALVDDFKDSLMATAEPVPGQVTPHDPRAGYGLFRADRLANAMAG